MDTPKYKRAPDGRIIITAEMIQRWSEEDAARQAARPRVRIRLPKQPPEPEPRQCVLCQEVREGWHFMSEISGDVCHRCARDGRLGSGWSLTDYFDRCQIEAARAVIRHLESEHAPQT